MLKLMPGIKALRIYFYAKHKEDWMPLIETITDYNPRIKELKFNHVNEEILKEIAKKIGPKIKILYLYDYNKQSTESENIGSTFEFKEFPKLKELWIHFCHFEPEMLESIPGTLKKIELIWLEDENYLKSIKALINSNHSSSIECLIVYGLCSQGFELICENFKNLRFLRFYFQEQFNPRNIRKLKHLNGFDLGSG